MPNLFQADVAIRDGANLDPFSRLRVSTPEYLFDCSFVADDQPLLVEKLTTGTGAAVAHDATNRCLTFTFDATADGVAGVQTFDAFRYQPGRGQTALLTFNFIEPKNGVTKHVGLSDGSNGVELRQTGSAVTLHLLSTTAKGNESVAKAAWNLDTLDGSNSVDNPSGLTLDLTKTHILVIDFQWLGVGRVRVGFDIGGVIVYVHEFNHANIQTVPYMATPNLPARAGMTSTTAASTTMRFICASVLSEGGQPDIAGFAMSTNVAGTAASGARAHILSLRPKTTFNSLPNRGRIIVDNVSLAVTGSNPVLWELCVGQAISGTTTFADINAYSQVEANSAGTISGSPAIVIASGYATATATARSGISQAIASRYPVTLNAAGAQRALGTLSLIATGIGGSSTVRAGISWREMR